MIITIGTYNIKSSCVKREFMTIIEKPRQELKSFGLSKEECHSCSRRRTLEVLLLQSFFLLRVLLLLRLRVQTYFLLTRKKTVREVISCDYFSWWLFDATYLSYCIMVVLSQYIDLPSVRVLFIFQKRIHQKNLINTYTYIRSQPIIGQLANNWPCYHTYNHCNFAVQ